MESLKGLIFAIVVFVVVVPICAGIWKYYIDNKVYFYYQDQVSITEGFYTGYTGIVEEHIIGGNYLVRIKTGEGREDWESVSVSGWYMEKID